MRKEAVAVSEVVSLIKSTLENEVLLNQVVMIGELSNVAISANKHMYFTLKDEKARLSCVMFSSAAKKVRTPFKEGDQVLVYGRISLYEAGGNLQCYVSDMQLSGLGNLYVQLEQTRKKLAKEGYFDEAKKKKLPNYPKRIGLVTSYESAAYHDVISTLKRRWPIAEIVFVHSQVQGVQAITQLKDAITLLDQQACDVLLIVRGGGSIEDLWSFNDESVIKHLALCSTPIISGVGHESDLTLVDYVVDKRAPTPTGAAELASPHVDDVHFSLLKVQESLHNKMTSLLDYHRHSLNTIKNHRFFVDPLSMTLQHKHTIERLKNRLFTHVQKMIYQKQTLETIKQRLFLAMQVQVKTNRTSLEHIAKQLHAYSHQSALKRGYSITYHNDQIISSIHQVSNNEIIITHVSDGIIKSKVEQTEGDLYE